MIELEKLQQHFKNHLVKGDKNILSDIVSTPDLSSQDRLNIYENAYYARLEEALQEDFPAIHTLLGDEEFSSLSRRYTESHPSRFFSLRWFGQYMAEFLRKTSPYSDYPYLYEMAIFEWRFTDAFDAEDVQPISESEFASIPAESWPLITLALHPSVSWFDYRWNILPVWKAARDDAEIPELVSLDQAQTCVVWRQELTTKYRTLDPYEALLIRAVAENRNFSQWCEILVEEGESPEEVPMLSAGILKTWLGLGMITGVSY